LEILAKTKDPTNVQPHLGKCFEAIDKVKFGPGNVITHMISPELEEVPLNVQVNPESPDMKGNVEKWMKDLEIKMKQTIKHIINKAKVDFFSDKSFFDWIKTWQAMCVIAIDQYNWTLSTEEALRQANKNKNSLSEFRDKLEEGRMEIVEIVKGKLSSDDRKKIGAMITLKVHNLEIIENMVANKINNENEFEWKSQLR